MRQAWRRRLRTRNRWSGSVRSAPDHIGSWIDLLKGNLSPELLRILCDPESGLFPRPEEWRFSCSCPDWADLCKHAAAVLYAFGVMLDDQPELLFMLRGIDASILIPDAPEPASGREDALDRDAGSLSRHVRDSAGLSRFPALRLPAIP